jgi:replicative DNA helicase
MNYGELLLSKVIDGNDVSALARFNVNEADFGTAPEREAYRFIKDYAERNRGQAPDFRTVVGEVKGFTYRAEVTNTYDHMVDKLKEHNARTQTIDFLQKEIGAQFNDKKPFELLEWIADRAQEIKRSTEYRTKVGTDLVADREKFKTEYLKRKAGESFKVWLSKFDTINNEIGGYFSGNMYTWYGRSGRGKSVFTMEEALFSALQGATVLIWAMEMAEFEWLARAYASISARKGYTKATINGINYEAGFPTKEILMGTLSDEWETGFMQFLDDLNSIVDGRIIIRSVDHEDFAKRNCSQLEADILQLKADVVVVDPIYYMNYEENTSRTAGGDVANTSKKLRYIAGHTGAVIHVITQAEEVKDDTDEEGNRELRPPKRAEIKKTKAVLEDATNTFGIDSVDGRAIIEIGKGRNGGEGTQIEVLYLPNYGIVKEVDFSELAEHFDFS